MTLAAVSKLLTVNVEFDCNGLYFEGYFHYLRFFTQRTLLT